MLSQRTAGLLLACSALWGVPAIAAPQTDPTCERVAVAQDRIGIPASMPHRPKAKPLLTAEAQAEDDAPDEKALTDELAAMLQACSYDGSPLKVSAAALAAGAGGSGEEAVARVMRFTGLPQNFRVVEGDVPNAAAMIVLGPDGLPQRVIAYNARFMQEVADATGGAAPSDRDWASLSILAHEIGHHLSGHTLVPGGSQPPLELEADKFSGFVLFRMGAPLPDAQKAIAALVPERDGPTHPGRPKRLAAVEAGWNESCALQPGGCPQGEETVVAAAEPPPPPPATAPEPERTEIPGPAAIRMPGTHPASAGDAVLPPEALDRVPRLSVDATPAKFDRFVYDEVGVFHPAIKKELSERAFSFARTDNVEVVTIVARDLQGRSADLFALQAMRQLRVGKLETGNGAVLVVAPETGEVGVALGAGLSIQYADLEELRSYLRRYLDVVKGGGRPQVASDLIVAASDRVMRDAQGFEWLVRYPDLASFEAAGERFRAEQTKTGAPYDPARDPTWRKLVRVQATLITASPDKLDAKLGVNAVKERRSPAIQVRTADGRDAVVYVDPSVPALMPVGLEEGRTYAFVLRDTFLEGTVPQLDLVSYDLLR